MPDTANALLEAVSNLLKATPAVTAVVDTRVYSSPPHDVTYPFVRVTVQSQPFASQSFSGMQLTLRIQAFDRKQKPGIPLKIREACFDALNRREDLLTVAGGTVVQIEHDGIADCFPEGDGKTWQSVLEFSVLIQ